MVWNRSIPCDQPNIHYIRPACFPPKSITPNRRGMKTSQPNQLSGLLTLGKSFALDQQSSTSVPLPRTRNYPYSSRGMATPMRILWSRNGWGRSSLQLIITFANHYRMSLRARNSIRRYTIGFRNSVYCRLAYTLQLQHAVSVP